MFSQREDRKISASLFTDLTEAQQAVYTVIEQNPGMTARELRDEFFSEMDSIPYGTLKELQNKGFIYIAGHRWNWETQKSAQTYFAVVLE